MRRVLFAQNHLGHLWRVMAIFVIGFLSQILLWINPGFYSHDELQWRDVVLQKGLQGFIAQLSEFHVGESFGYPVRPLTFLILGLEGLLVENGAQLVHAISVLVTGAVGSLLYWILLRHGLGVKTALSAGLIFLLLPTTVLATGWSAALMDQWFVLFGLGGILLTQSFLKSQRLVYLAGVSMMQILALMSKETAIVWPAIFLILYYFFIANSRRGTIGALQLFCAWGIPTLIYASWRLNAVLASFSDSTQGGYSASIENLPINIFAYFSFPFLTPITELHTYTLLPIWALVFGVLAHLFCVFWALFQFGVRSAVGYLVVYFGFVAPLLFIEGLGSHYLYASGLAMSVVFASLLVGSKSLPVKGFAFFVICVLYAHSITMQVRIYSDGVCSKRLLDSVEVQYAYLGSPKVLKIYSQDGKPNYVLTRMFFGRNQIGPEFPIDIKVQDGFAVESGNSIVVDKTCVAIVN